MEILINYLSENRSELDRLIVSSIFVEQLDKNIYVRDNFLFDNISQISKSALDTYFQFFKNNCFKLKTTLKGKYINIEVLNIYLNKFSEKVLDEDLLPWVNSLNPVEIKNQLSSTINIIAQLEQYRSCREIIIEKWEIIIKQLYSLADDSFYYTEIKTLFDIYDIDFEKFHSQKDNNQFVAECLHNIFSENIRQNLDISHKIKEKIFEHIEQGDRDSAESLINELILEEYSGFLKESEMPNYTGSTLDIDLSSIADKIYYEMTTSNDDFKSNIKSNKSERIHTSEQSEIIRLFEG